MYRDKYGVPYLTNEKIEKLGEAIIKDYNPSLLEKPGNLDIEHFMENYLKLNIDYQYLSSNGCILGMMVFDNAQIIVFDPSENRTEYLNENADTIVLDARLLEDEHVLTFTAAHECAHKLLHSDVYMKPAIQCRKRNEKWGDKEAWPKERTIEYQANALGAALLMPRLAVIRLITNVEDDIGAMVAEVSKVYNVSLAAAFYRLKSLEFIDKNVSYEEARDLAGYYNLKNEFIF